MQWSLGPARQCRCLPRPAQLCSRLSLFEIVESLEDRSDRLLPRVPASLRRQRTARLDIVRPWPMLRADSEARLQNDIFWSVLQRSRVARPVLRVQDSEYPSETGVQRWQLAVPHRVEEICLEELLRLDSRR